MKTLSWGLLLSSSLFLQSVAETQCAQPHVAIDPKFEPGQVWSYKTRPGEERSTVTILRVEKTPKLRIIHVRIDGIRFSNCTGGPAPKLVEHAPFTRAALEASLTEKMEPVPTLPDYSAGYREWLSHCGGVYTIPVAEMVALDDAQFGASLGCH